MIAIPPCGRMGYGSALRKHDSSIRNRLGCQGLLVMQMFRSRSAVLLAAAAAVSLSATPVLARDRYRHHDDGIDGGDVLAGLLIVGGIAAIASAASSKAKKDRQAREDARYRDDYRPGDYQGGYAPQNDYRGGDHRPGDYPQNPTGTPRADYGAPRGDDWRDRPSSPPAANAARVGYGVDGAVDACVGEVERGAGSGNGRSVENVDGVNREGEGWRVAGRVRGGYGFSCVVDRDGRVKSVAGL